MQTAAVDGGQYFASPLLQPSVPSDLGCLIVAPADL